MEHETDFTSTHQESPANHAQLVVPDLASLLPKGGTTNTIGCGKDRLISVRSYPFSLPDLNTG